MKIEPIADYVFLKYDKEESGKSGIVFSDITKNKQEIGIVEAAGPETKLKKGQKVVFNPFGGRQVNVDNKEYIIRREKEIYAVLS